MKSLDRLAQSPRDPSHRLRRVAFSQDRFQHFSHLPGRYPAPEGLAHQSVHRLLPPLIAWQQLPPAAPRGARYPQPTQQPEVRAQVPPTGLNIMKGYMKDGVFSRGRDIITAEGSGVFVGNLDGNIETIIRTSNLFYPTKERDTAFFDRIHACIRWVGNKQR